MKRVRRCVAAAVLMAPAVAVGVTALPGGASAGTFSITPWGLPGGVAGGTSGTTIGFGGGPAINAASVAVGAGQDGTFPGPPALMYGSGHLTILPKLDFGALGHQTDYATGINSGGVIAGIGQFAPALSGGVTFQALEWKSGGVTDLSPGVDALALSINDTGTVVGYQDFNGGTSSASSEAVQFNAGRAPTGLGFLSSPSSPPQSAAFGISQSGQIVGDALNSSAQELPVTFAGGVATPLPLPAGTASGGASAVSQPLIVLPPLIDLPIASLPVVGPSLNAALNSLLGL